MTNTGTITSTPDAAAPSGPTDGESALLARARDGDEAAFREIVATYTPKVWGVAQRILGRPAEAEDVVQEVFFKVHRKLHTFREDAALSTWLYRVTMNAAADYLKRRRSDRSVLVEDFGALALEDPQDSPEAEADREDQRRLVRQAIAELPDIFRDVLVLRELEGLPYEEIAETLGLSKGTVESRLFRARARVRDWITRAEAKADRPEARGGERDAS